MYQLIDKFIESAKEMDDDIFPFMANKKEFVEGKNSVYYSGPVSYTHLTLPTTPYV